MWFYELKEQKIFSSRSSFDLRLSNVNDTNVDKMNPDVVPDVVLVKKVYADKATRNRRRRWKLKHLELQDDTGSQNKWVW